MQSRNLLLGGKTSVCESLCVAPGLLYMFHYLLGGSERLQMCIVVTPYLWFNFPQYHASSQSSRKIINGKLQHFSEQHNEISCHSSFALPRVWIRPICSMCPCCVCYPLCGDLVAISFIKFTIILSRVYLQVTFILLLF